MRQKREIPAKDDEVTFDEAIAEILGPDATDQWNMDGWLFRHRIEAKDGAEVLRRVFLNSDPRWLSAFIVMLLLSGAIATLGLSQDSAATVIGSMIVAPLSAPIVALGGAIAVVWPREAAKMFTTVVAGAVIVVVVSYITGIFLPDSTPTAQILARTSPDLRDLAVALLAGAAGAYAQTRSSLSSSMPDAETEEVTAIFRQYGLSDEQIMPVVAAIRADQNRWVDFMMRFELGWKHPTQPAPDRAPSPSHSLTSRAASSPSRPTSYWAICIRRYLFPSC